MLSRMKCLKLHLNYINRKNQMTRDLTTKYDTRKARNMDIIWHICHDCSLTFLEGNGLR